MFPEQLAYTVLDIGGDKGERGQEGRDKCTAHLGTMILVAMAEPL